MELGVVGRTPSHIICRGKRLAGQHLEKLSSQESRSGSTPLPPAASASLDGCPAELTRELEDYLAAVSAARVPSGTGISAAGPGPQPPVTQPQWRVLRPSDVAARWYQSLQECRQGPCCTDPASLLFEVGLGRGVTIPDTAPTHACCFVWLQSVMVEELRPEPGEVEEVLALKQRLLALLVGFNERVVVLERMVDTMALHLQVWLEAGVGWRRLLSF